MSDPKPSTGFSVIYKHDTNNTVNSCYWAETKQEAEDYKSCVEPMFPSFVFSIRDNALDE